MTLEHLLSAVLDVPSTSKREESRYCGQNKALSSIIHCNSSVRYFCDGLTRTSLRRRDLGPEGSASVGLKDAEIECRRLRTWQR